MVIISGSKFQNCLIDWKSIAINLLSLFCIIPVCNAHPHNWVTTRSEFELNDAGHLVAISQVWRFDYFYSAILIAELANDWQQSLPKAFELEAHRMVTNLKSYNYFSVLSLAGRDRTLPVPDRYRLQVVKDSGQEFVELSMHFKLTPPLLLKDSELIWSVFDPTYYIAYSHEHVDNVKIHHPAGWQCGKQLRLPEITEELIAYAFSLDRTQRDTDGLGQAFAEKIVIGCRPES